MRKPLGTKRREHDNRNNTIILYRIVRTAARENARPWTRSSFTLHFPLFVFAQIPSPFSLAWALQGNCFVSDDKKPAVSGVFFVLYLVLDSKRKKRSGMLQYFPSTVTFAFSLQYITFHFNSPNLLLVIRLNQCGAR
ncbi:hypothetical protein GGS21DRAFT_445919 [Xylaria nigripes]|nr:hypothetical protein GGS21DRAFT_445919 [Xylaria nigripes]